TRNNSGSLTFVSPHVHLANSLLDVLLTPEPPKRQRPSMSQSAQLLARFPALERISGWPKPALLGLAAAAVTVLVALLLWARAPDYKVLFSNIEDRDGGAIV